MVVERSFAWIACYCHMSKDNEFLTASAGAMVLHTMFRLMLTRPAHPLGAGQGGRGMGTSDLANCPTTDEALACRPAAAFATDPCNESPLSVANSAVATRKQHNLFIDTPSLFEQAMFV